MADGDLTRDLACRCCCAVASLGGCSAGSVEEIAIPCRPASGVVPRVDRFQHPVSGETLEPTPSPHPVPLALAVTQTEHLGNGRGGQIEWPVANLTLEFPAEGNQQPGLLGPVLRGDRWQVGLLRSFQ